MHSVRMGGIVLLGAMLGACNQPPKPVAKENNSSLFTFSKVATRQQDFSQWVQGRKRFPGRLTTEERHADLVNSVEGSAIGLQATTSLPIPK
jgi:hypothetical protein